MLWRENWQTGNLWPLFGEKRSIMLSVMMINSLGFTSTYHRMSCLTTDKFCLLWQMQVHKIERRRSMISNCWHGHISVSGARKLKVKLFPLISLGTLPTKKRDFLGIFPKGGGVFSNPKTFVNLPSVFFYAKIILRCQNMFYNSGEVIFDQFHHITLNSKSGKFWKKSAKTRSFGNFFHCEGGGSPIPKSICQNSYQKVKIFVKTKNAK